jgi:uncharacterized protein (TIGR03435 family)
VNHSYRILGPDWLNGDQDRYDVTAKIPAGATKEQFSLMLQHLLLERFQIVWHWENKEVSGYGLLIGKNRPKMKASGSNAIGAGGPSEETAKSECSQLHVGKSPDVQVSASPKGVCFVAVQQPMSRLADFLEGTLTRPVADRTGLTGLYDFTLFYSVEGTFLDRTIRPDSEGAPYVITAVQEQLGLKLEPEKNIRRDFLVVDRANRMPTDN